MANISLSFLLGVIVFQTSSVMPSYFCLLLLPASIYLCAKKFSLLPILFFSLGYLWSFIFSLYMVYPQLSEQLEGKDVQVSGYISEVKSESHQFSKFIFNINESSIAQLDSNIPEKVILSWFQAENKIQDYQQCDFVVRLKKIWGFSNPGNVDYEKNMFIKGIGARGYVRSGQCIQDKKVDDKVSLRQIWISQFQAIAPNYEYSQLMQALTFGHRENINQQQWLVLRKTGTSHLLAISGLHLSAISLVVFFVTASLVRCSAWICEMIPARVIAAIFAMIASTFYAYLAGFSLPTQRALIMVTAGLLAILLRKPVINIPVLSCALLLVLIINPLSVLTAGFWMSFLAVLFIFIVLKSTEGKSKLFRIVAVQCYLGFALFPISLFFFSQASVISPVVNLIAIPLVSFLLLPLLLLTQLLFLFDAPLCHSMFSVIDQLFAWLWWSLNESAKFKYSSLEFSPKLMGVIAYELGLFMLVQAKGLPARYLACVLLTGLFLIKEPGLKNHQMRMTVLDVGQGLSVVIETKNHALIYDAGARSPSGFNTGEVVVLPFLRSRDISKVDLAIVSHNDNDHSGGMHSILAAGVVRELMVSNLPRLYDFKPVKLCRSGDEWHWDGVKFQVLHPPEKWHSNDNNRSCVLQIIHSAGNIMLSGDIEKSAEEKLIAQYGDNLASDLIIAPHHGSKSSSSYRFVDLVHPQTVVFSAGYRNRYGFPHATISQRYQEMGAQIVETARQGAVTFLFDANDGLQIQAQHRLDSKRYWHSTQQETSDPIE
ncbi:MAG: DNA internalization-related competence protein ComEC/Rec2 [Gammaproteobacteria bacterium]|nr:DNA internalization-related competence protein ComEC/Rec2 [Gammaproteobacteria bacterium]